MRRFCLISLSVFLFFTKGIAQPLTVGDVMPDLKNIRFFKDGKYSTINIEFSKLGDKLVIFDFWSPACAPCIAGLPKMDSMQKKFGDKIIILPVVGTKTQLEGEKIIADFWMKSPFSRRSTSLGSLVESKEKATLYKYFPNAGLPWEVWVKNGKIVGLTGHEYVNEKEITDVLAGKRKEWAIHPGGATYKNGYYDYSIPLPVYLSGSSATSFSEKIIYSVLGGYIPNKREGSNLGFNIRKRKENKFTFINTSILDLYQFAIEFPVKYQLQKQSVMSYDNRYILEVKDISRYKKPDNILKPEWLKENSFSYELVLPLSYSLEEVCNYMIQDLNKFFQLNGRIEKRKVKCWVLRKNSTPLNFDPGFENRMMEVRDSLIKRMGTDEYEANLIDVSFKRGWREREITNIETLFGILNERSKDMPVVDESNFSGKLSFLFRSGSKITFQEYQEQLHKNGFDLKIEEREVDLVVITEKANVYTKP